MDGGDVLAKLSNLDELFAQMERGEVLQPPGLQPTQDEMMEVPLELPVGPPIEQMTMEQLEALGEELAALEAGMPAAKKPRLENKGPQWQCDCGFKNNAANEVCGGKGPMGCKSPNPNPAPIQLPSWDSSSGSAEWDTGYGKGKGDGYGKGDSGDKGKGKEVKSAKWQCLECNFHNDQKNEVCGGRGEMGCKSPNPNPTNWTCECGFKNEAKNEYCGGNGPMGCKWPKPPPKAPTMWICKGCKFKNNIENDVCGGQGPMGCKAPKAGPVPKAGPPASSSQGGEWQSGWQDKGEWKDSGWTDKGDWKEKGEWKDKGEQWQQPPEMTPPPVAAAPAEDTAWIDELQAQLAEQLAKQAQEQNLDEEQKQQLGLFYQHQLAEHIKQMAAEKAAAAPEPEPEEEWEEEQYESWEQARVKIAMCKFNMAGQCGRGADCTYAHSEDELRPPLKKKGKGKDKGKGAGKDKGKDKGEDAGDDYGKGMGKGQVEEPAEPSLEEMLAQQQAEMEAEMAGMGVPGTALAIIPEPEAPAEPASEEQVRNDWLMQVAGALLAQQEQQQQLQDSGVDPNIIAQATALAFAEAANMVNMVAPMEGAPGVIGGGHSADIQFWQHHQALLCKFHVMGSCKNGRLCNYPHTNEDLVPKLLTKGFCKAFLVSNCPKGDECKYKHALSEVDIIPFQEMAEKQWKEQLAQQQREQEAILRSGDWKCPGCGNLNFAKRDICNTKGCGLTRLASIMGNVVPMSSEARIANMAGAGTGAKADEQFWRDHAVLLCKFHVKGDCRDGEMCNFPHSFEDMIPKLLTKRYCKAYLVAECMKGDNCRYKHNPAETSLSEVLQSRSMICKSWMKGLCSKGAECIYAHSEEELVKPTDVHKYKTAMCRHFLENRCAKGSVCTFAHVETEIIPPETRKPGGPLALGYR